MQEDQIVLVSLLMAELGVHSVAYAFPKVQIVTTAVDKGLDDLLHVVPGIGKSSPALARSLCQTLKETVHDFNFNAENNKQINFISLKLSDLISRRSRFECHRFEATLLSM